MTSPIHPTMRRCLVSALVLGAVASGCAHTRERATVSAVTNAQASGDPREPAKHKMHYTQVRGEQANPSPKGDDSAGTREGYAIAGPVDRADGPCELSVYFADNSSMLDSEAKRRLALVAGCLKRKDIDHATVAGYTDRRGSESENLTLSQRRAQVTAQYLETQGVPSSDIRVVGEGEKGASQSNQLWPVERRSEVRAR